MDSEPLAEPLSEDETNVGLGSGLAIGGDGRKVIEDGGGKNETTRVKN